MHALPLRILLILALMLDGIGGAVAGVLASLPPEPAALSVAVAVGDKAADELVSAIATVVGAPAQD